MRRWSGSFVIPILVATPSLGAESPNYHRDVAPILQKHCQECHRPGQVAPFSLLTYDQARKRAADLGIVTAEKRMPPWHASESEGGPFKDARVLTSGEMATIASWVEAGSPEGDPKDAPAPREFRSDWALGEPDLILKPTKAFTLGATGRDEFRVFVLPTGLTEGKWIAAVDFHPGNAKVVHHTLAGIDTAKRARKLDEADPGPGYKTFAGFGEIAPGIPLLPSGGLGGWAPGKAPRFLPEGVGRWMPAGSDVMLQVHYHKSGKVETDATSVGLYFAKGTVDKQLRGGVVMPPRSGPLSRPDLKISPGNANYEVAGTLKLDDNFHLASVVPHMHWLGKDFDLTAELPNGSKRTLIKIDRWDFNWQDTYEFSTPVALPAGTTIRMTAHFDNSGANPANPSHPPVEVRWGEQTTNEMCIGFLQLTKDDEHLKGKPPERPPVPLFNRGRAGR